MVNGGDDPASPGSAKTCQTETVFLAHQLLPQTIHIHTSSPTFHCALFFSGTPHLLPTLDIANHIITTAAAPAPATQQGTVKCPSETLRPLPGRKAARQMRGSILPSRSIILCPRFGATLSARPVSHAEPKRSNVAADSHVASACPERNHLMSASTS